MFYLTEYIDRIVMSMSRYGNDKTVTLGINIVCNFVNLFLTKGTKQLFLERYFSFENLHSIMLWTIETHNNSINYINFYGMNSNRITLVMV